MFYALGRGVQSGHRTAQGMRAIKNFSPLDLFPSVWLHAPDTQSIQDTGGRVDHWDGQGETPLSVTANGAARPTTDVVSANGFNLLQFDGTDDYFTFGTDTIGNTTLFARDNESFSVFVTCRFSDQGYAIAKAGGNATTQQFGIYLSGNTDIKVLFRGLHYVVKSNYVKGDMITVGVVWDGQSAQGALYDQINIYVNDEPPVVREVGTAAEETSQNIVIGARTNGPGFLAEMDLAGVAIWDRALMEDEVQRYIGYYSTQLNQGLDFTG